MWRVALLLSCALRAYAFEPGETAITQEGAFWLQTVSGAEPASPRLRISARGPVKVRGVAEDQVRYTLTKKVKAKNELEARRLFGRYLVKAYRQGDWTIL